tara:strand:+ start:299 stop:457 length:159 start_codon:yes stop_codon:yes gene_type:complete
LSHSWLIPNWISYVILLELADKDGNIQEALLVIYERIWPLYLIFIACAMLLV